MIKIGTKDLKNLMIGSTQVKKVMVREVQEWTSSDTLPPSPPFDPSVKPDNIISISSDSFVYIHPSSQHTIKIWKDGWKNIEEVFTKLDNNIYGIDLSLEGENIFIAGNLRGANSDIDSTQFTFASPTSINGKLSSLFNYNFNNYMIDNSYCRDYAAYGLFANNAQEIDAQSLEFDLKGAPHCYDSTFQNANLGTALINLAGDVQQNYFLDMFKDSKIKVLRFNTSGHHFYGNACEGMLAGCTELKEIYIDVKPSQVHSNSVFGNWALNVSNSGTIHLRKDTSLTELQAIDGLIPRYWNVIQDI